MAEQEKNFLQQLIDSFSSWKVSFEGLREGVGWLAAALLVLLAAVIAACFYVWSNWKDIKERPGVERIVAWFNEHALPAAPPGRLTIAVAHLARDNERLEHERLLLNQLRQFEGVETLRVDRTVDPEDQEKKIADEKARDLLRQTGADVLIWGSVESLSGKSAMQLYWTPARDVPGAKSTGKYLPQTETIALPLEFWNDLKQVLGLLTQSRIAAVTLNQPVHYVADKLAPLIVQVRELEEAVSAYREALQERTRERVPLQWAMTQMNLGNALMRLGERESGTGKLTEAVSAYREALQEYTRERVPLQWAATQMNLGAALKRLGERESGTGKLEEAVSAYCEALQEYTRERVPLDWARTQMNLGNALGALGERESGTGKLEEAASAFREALKEFDQERAPYYRAMDTRISR